MASYRTGRRGDTWDGGGITWHGFRLENVLYDFRGEKATEPQDQIQRLKAMVSFATGWPHLIPYHSFREWIAPQPSWALPPPSIDEAETKTTKLEDAFLKGARDIISRDRDLSILHHHNVYLPKKAPYGKNSGQLTV